MFKLKNKNEKCNQCCRWSSKMSEVKKKLESGRKKI